MRAPCAERWRRNYGKPTYVRGSSDLVWVGCNPDKPDGEPVKIKALIGTENGQAAPPQSSGLRENHVVLQISLIPYVDPQRPKLVLAQPTVPGLSRL